MDQLTVFKFLEEKKDFLFPNDEYSEIKIEEAIMEAPESFEFVMSTISFRKPSTMQIISIFPGSLGVDRFLLGDIVKGVLKYFTFGGFGIWWIKDIISAKKRCRAYNCKKLLNALHNPQSAGNKNVKAFDIDNIDLDKAIQIGKAVAPVVKELSKGAKDIGSTFEVK